MDPCRLTSTLAEYVSVRVFNFISTPLVHFFLRFSAGLILCALTVKHVNYLESAKPIHPSIVREEVASLIPFDDVVGK